MKKSVNYLSAALMSLLVTGVAYAQTPSPAPVPTPHGMPTTLNEPTMNQRLQTDLTERNSSIGETPVTWWDSENSYNGTYSINNVDYMATYDKKGNYVGSYRKGQWSEVPASFRTSYDQSLYKGQNVTGYWESADPKMKGYYLELDNGKGRSSRVWVDDKNKYLTTPPMGNGNKPKN